MEITILFKPFESFGALKITTNNKKITNIESIKKTYLEADEDFVYFFLDYFIGREGFVQSTFTNDESDNLNILNFYWALKYSEKSIGDVEILEVKDPPEEPDYTELYARFPVGTEIDF